MQRKARKAKVPKEKRKHTQEYLNYLRRFRVATRLTAMNYFKDFGCLNKEAMAFLNSNHELVKYYFPAWHKKMKQDDTDFIRDFIITEIQSQFLNSAMEKKQPVNFGAWFKQITEMAKFADDRQRDSSVNIHFSKVE